MTTTQTSKIEKISDLIIGKKYEMYSSIGNEVKRVEIKHISSHVVTCYILDKNMQKIHSRILSNGNFLYKSQLFQFHTKTFIPLNIN